jgi:hypothetical protein
MSEDLGLGTMTGEHEKPDIEESPNTKIHGQPEGAPMPGVERDEPAKVKEEVNPNTE